MEQKVRELRLEVDKFINSVSKLNPSREVSLCHTSLQRAKAWLGEALKEFGSNNPYPNSTNPQNSTIEPQAEHGFETIWNGFDMLEGTQVAHVKFFRQQIDEYQKIFQQTFFYSASDMIGSSFAVINSKMAMIEAKHWLGWELDRIRNAKEGGTSTQRVLLNE